MGTNQHPATYATGNTDPWGILTGPVATIAVCVFCRGAGQVSVGQDHNGAELMQTCRRCSGTGAPDTVPAGRYLFSKYTLRDHYGVSGTTLVQGDRVYGLTDPFEILAESSVAAERGMVLYRAWDVYEDATGRRFSVETYHEDHEVLDAQRGVA